MKQHYTNVLTQKLTKASKNNGPKIWARVADELTRPSRIARRVNLSRIARVSDGKLTVLVPGKVLGVGTIQSPITVAAMSWSASAAQKITQAKGSIITIDELLENNPKGTKIKIIG